MSLTSAQREYAQRWIDGYNKLHEKTVRLKMTKQGALNMYNGIRSQKKATAGKLVEQRGKVGFATTFLKRFTETK